MKKQFDFETGKVITEYEEDDVINPQEINNSLTLSEAREAKLNELVYGLYNFLLEIEEPPLSALSVDVLLDIIEFKMQQIREGGEIEVY